jgi:hypothetical protein
MLSPPVHTKRHGGRCVHGVTWDDHMSNARAKRDPGRCDSEVARANPCCRVSTYMRIISWTRGECAHSLTPTRKNASKWPGKNGTHHPTDDDAASTPGHKSETMNRVDGVWGLSGAGRLGGGRKARGDVMEGVVRSLCVQGCAWCMCDGGTNGL